MILTFAWKEMRMLLQGEGQKQAKMPLRVSDLQSVMDMDMGAMAWIVK